MNAAAPDHAAASGGSSPGAAELLRLTGITKRFPGVEALVGVDFDLRAGEAHILFGENGAGKSTLISIIAGVYGPSAGRISLRGKEVEFGSVHEARASGISAVFQEFPLVPQLTVEENMFLGAELTNGPFLDKAGQHRRAVEVLDNLGFPLKANGRVAYLSRAEQQMVEIAKAFRTQPSILIFDEPTASLTERETERLFALIEQAKKAFKPELMNRFDDLITKLNDGQGTAGQLLKDRQLYENMNGAVGDLRSLLTDIRKDPKKFLNVKVSIF